MKIFGKIFKVCLNHNACLANTQNELVSQAKFLLHNDKSSCVLYIGKGLKEFRHQQGLKVICARYVVIDTNRTDFQGAKFWEEENQQKRIRCLLVSLSW